MCVRHVAINSVNDECIHVGKMDASVCPPLGELNVNAHILNMQRERERERCVVQT